MEQARPRPPATARGPKLPPLCCASSTTFLLKITPTCAGKQARAARGAARRGRANAARACSPPARVSRLRLRRSRGAQAPPRRRPRTAPEPSKLPRSRDLAQHPISSSALQSALQLSSPNDTSSRRDPSPQVCFLPPVTTPVLSRPPPINFPSISARGIGSWILSYSLPPLLRILLDCLLFRGGGVREAERGAWDLETCSCGQSARGVA